MGSPSGALGALAPEDRPREKLLAKGAASLTDEELLALVLGTGTAGKPVLETSRELLRDGGLPGLFAKGPAALVALRRGIGQAKATRVAAVLEIACRVHRAAAGARDLLSDPEAVRRYLALALAGETREVMGGLLLDAKNRLLRDAVVFRGTTTGAQVTPGPLFREAILAGAAGLLLYHNHPSGDPEPSAEDRATTARFVAAGREIGIPVRDHVVVGRGRAVSFHERGWL